MTQERDYFDGYRSSAPHPFMTSTGSEGRCDICGARPASREHDRPWTRVAAQVVQPAESFIGEPY